MNLAIIILQFKRVKNMSIYNHVDKFVVEYAAKNYTKATEFK